MLLGLAIVALIAGAAIVVIVIARGSRRRGVRRPPPVVYPLYPTRKTAGSPKPARAVAEHQVNGSPKPRPAPVERPAGGPPSPTNATAFERPAVERPAIERPAATDGTRQPKSRRNRKGPEVERPIAAATEPDTSPTVRFRRPSEDAVQVLPGRLEVLAGEPHHKEIRLVRRPGEQAEVILGREFGDMPGHVALQSTTVSRRHARLAYANGQWRVANLSQTNPLVVNDEALSVGNGERTLADGDCLELGEVVLRFHAS